MELQQIPLFWRFREFRLKPCNVNAAQNRYNKKKKPDQKKNERIVKCFTFQIQIMYTGGFSAKVNSRFPVK